MVGLFAPGQVATRPLYEGQSHRFNRYALGTFSPAQKAHMIDGRPVVVPGFGWVA